MAAHRWLTDSKLGRIVAVVVLAALVLLHAIGNWRWLTANVTILGWDVPSHLGTSFIYNDILRPLTLKGLFSTMVWHPNRPPLYFLSTVPLYRVAGVSVDVGTMVNVVYMAVLFGSVYGIGRRMGGRRVGLLAAFVVATLPMIYAVSRFFYLELALTAMVALSIYLLLVTKRFENRRASILFGISVGLGLLTKRTYLAFMVAPLCLVVLRSGAWQGFRTRLRSGLRLSVKDVLLSLGLGLALAAVWYIPSREIAGDLLLGLWLLPLWALLIAATIYLLRLKPGPDTNLLSALFLGGAIGSLWYLPRITFVQRLLSFGLGINDPRGRSANLDQMSTYFYFLVRLVNEHISLVTFALLLFALLGFVLAFWKRGRIWTTLRRAGDVWWVTVLWIVAAYLIFTFSIYRKSRGITPVLPALALLLAAGLFLLPWKRVVTVLVVLVIAWGLLQFSVLSFEGLHWLAEETSFTLPGLGQTGAFAQGGTLQLPASGETDPGYWVVPEILEVADAERRESAAESIKLGVVVNNEHVNPDLFGLMALQDHAGVQVNNLARTGDTGSAYNQFFGQDYLVLIDGDYLLIDAATQDALAQLEEDAGLFDAAFELAEEYHLPDGQTVLLYRKVQRLEPGYAIDDYRSAARSIESMAQEGDAILLVPPEQAEALGQTHSGNLPAYFLPQEQPLDPEGTARTLEQIASRHPVLFAVFREEGSVDPDRFVESWLNEHAYPSQIQWHGGVRLAMYGAPLTGVDGSLPVEDESAQPLYIKLGEQVRLLGYSLVEDEAAPGAMLRLTLFWQAEGPLEERLTVFAHLLDGGGRLVAQQDSEPVGGSRPTTTWLGGEVIVDRLGILIPAHVASGEYPLLVGLYDPATSERLPALDEAGNTLGDSISLTVIQMREP